MLINVAILSTGSILRGLPAQFSVVILRLRISEMDAYPDSAERDILLLPVLRFLQ